MRVAMTGHVCAGLRERDGNRLAQSGGSASHERNPAIESELVEDHVAASGRHQLAAFGFKLVITVPLAMPTTTPTSAPSAMYFSKLDPDTRESNPVHQPANDPKMLPMKPKPTMVPTENGLAATPSISSTGSMRGTNR